jgi:microcystin-dependent protein
MADPYLGEIRLFGGTFPPLGWAMCNGQLLSIADNSALFNLLGTTYGGDGVTTFGLPNLQGRLPLHQGQLSGGGTYVTGQSAGSETVTLTGNQIAAHSHLLFTGGAANQTNPATNLVGAPTFNHYLPPGSGGPLAFNAGSIKPSGGGQPHDNVMPFLVVSFIIALEGVYPSQN